MTISLVTLLFAVAVFTAAEVLRRLFIRVRSQPIWAKSQCVGGVIAACSMDDYIKAKAAGEMVDGKVLVRRTRWFRPDSLDCWRHLELKRFDVAPDLFVPFASEAHMSYADQCEFFLPPHKNFDVFAENVLEESMQESLLRRIAYYLDPLPGRWTSVTSTAARFSGAVAILSMIWFAGAWHMNNAERAKFESDVSYTTDANGLHKTEVAKDDWNKMLVHPDDVLSTDIYHGKVSSIVPLSVGMALACADRKKDHPLCGIAPSSVRIGDEAFIRSQEVCDWQFSDHSRCGYYSVTNWIITKQEADLLVSTGKFRVVD
ncbi:MAG TPA: hypothetical protein VF803_01285 [Candidatus Paceibacterota bacterium]